MSILKYVRNYKEPLVTWNCIIENLFTEKVNKFRELKDDIDKLLKTVHDNEYTYQRLVINEYTCVSVNSRKKDIRIYIRLDDEYEDYFSVEMIIKNNKLYKFDILPKYINDIKFSAIINKAIEVSNSECQQFNDSIHNRIETVNNMKSE